MKLSAPNGANQSTGSVAAKQFKGVDVAETPFLRFHGKNDANVLVTLGARSTRAIKAVPAAKRDATLVAAAKYQIANGVPARAKSPRILYVESIKAVLPSEA